MAARKLKPARVLAAALLLSTAIPLLGALGGAIWGSTDPELSLVGGAAEGLRWSITAWLGGFPVLLMVVVFWELRRSRLEAGAAEERDRRA